MAWTCISLIFPHSALYFPRPFGSQEIQGLGWKYQGNTGSSHEITYNHLHRTIHWKWFIAPHIVNWTGSLSPLHGADELTPLAQEVLCFSLQWFTFLATSRPDAGVIQYLPAKADPCTSTCTRDLCSTEEQEIYVVQNNLKKRLNQTDVENCDRWIDGQ